jgi:hypothetical protein
MVGHIQLLYPYRLIGISGMIDTHIHGPQFPTVAPMVQLATTPQIPSDYHASSPTVTKALVDSS